MKEIFDINLLSQIQGLAKKMSISQEEPYVQKRAMEKLADTKNRQKRRGKRGTLKTNEKKLEHEYEEKQEGKIDITI
jgi:hypothetical protein